MTQPPKKPGPDKDQNAPDAEYLLGGFATGTLTPEEKRILFAKALEDQTIFDALAEEEPLRELLTDPKARQRLLEALENASSKSVEAEPPTKDAADGEPKRARRPLAFLGLPTLKQHPAFLSAAAGLLIILTTTLMIKKSPEAYNPPPTQGADTIPMNKQAEQVQESLQEKDKRSESAKIKDGAKDRDGDSRTAGLLKQGVSPKKDSAKTTPPAPPAPAYSAPTTSPQVQEIGSVSADRAKEERPTSGGAQVLEMAVPPSDLKAEYGVSKAAKSAQAPFLAESKNHPAISYRILPLPGGGHRLEVAHASGFAYLVKRGRLTTVIPGQKVAGEADVTRFDYLLSEGEVLDLYVMDQPQDRPESLSAEGPVNGWRKRLK